MGEPSRISIVETEHELLIRNQPRLSTFKAIFIAVSAAIIATTIFRVLSEQYALVSSDFFGTASFFAIMLFFSFLLGRDFLWSISSGEILEVSRNRVARELKGFPFSKRESIGIGRHLGIEILDHAYDTDEVGLTEVLRITSTDGTLKFGRELSGPEAEIVADAIKAFADRHDFKVG